MILLIAVVPLVWGYEGASQMDGFADLGHEQRGERTECDDSAEFIHRHEQSGLTFYRMQLLP